MDDPPSDAEPDRPQAAGVRRRARRRRARRRRVRLVVTATALLAVAGGLGLGARIGWFYWRSNHGGSALVARERALIAGGGRGHTRPATCSAPTDAGSGPQGLLEAPAIGLEAPVVSGTADPELNVAVGHLTTSAWPGQVGTTVLAAHDVTWFSRIEHLATGDQIRFVTPCQTYVFSVSSHRIVVTGTAIASAATTSQLVMETCYPLDALYSTRERYLVEATLSAVLPHGGAVPVPAAPPALAVAAPPALLAQGLGLDRNDVILGQLALAGSPAPAWQQSPGPLSDESAVLAGYDGAVRAAEEGRGDWWSDLAPGVDFRAAGPLVSAHITSYLERLTPTLQVTGQQVTGAEARAEVTLSGGSDPGVYRIRMGAAVHGGTLLVTGWEMTRVR